MGIANGKSTPTACEMMEARALRARRLMAFALTCAFILSTVFTLGLFASKF